MSSRVDNMEMSQVDFSIILQEMLQSQGLFLRRAFSFVNDDVAKK